MIYSLLLFQICFFGDCHDGVSSIVGKNDGVYTVKVETLQD